MLESRIEVETEEDRDNRTSEYFKRSQDALEFCYFIWKGAPNRITQFLLDVANEANTQLTERDYQREKYFRVVGPIKFKIGEVKIDDC